MSQFTPTERTKVRRKPDRGSYDRELIYKILDQAFVCHVAFAVDGIPFVVPTNYVRVGDKLFLHGSPASRLMKALSSGPFCLSVTLLDGIVFSPTAMGHSVNYRSVVVIGKAEIVEGHAAKLAAMRDFVEYVVRGRWETVRPPTEQEIKATMVLAVPAVEVFVGFSQLQENYGQPGMDVPLMAAAAASAAGSATAGGGSGGFGGGTVAIASGGGKDGKLDAGFLAGALGAGDFLLLVEHDALEARVAVLADVFVDGHNRFLKYSSKIIAGAQHFK